MLLTQKDLEVKMRLLCLIFILLLLIYPLAIANSKIVAIVGDEPITIKEYKERLNHEEKRIGRPLDKEEIKGLLDKMIEEKILYKQALKKGLDKDKEAIFLIEEAKRNILINILIKREIIQRLKYTKKDLKKYYEAHKADYTDPEAISGRLFYIYKKDKEGKDRTNEAKDIAEKIEKRLAKGEGLKEPHKFYRKNTPLILQTSQFGYMPKNLIEKSYGKPFAEMAFGLKEGEVGMIELLDKFVVIKVTKKKKAYLRPFEEVKNKVEVAFQRQQFKKIYEEYLKKIKKGLLIKKYYKNLPPPNI